MPSEMKLEHLTFAAGPKPDDLPLEITVPTVIVLVGLNNSGKSIALGEVEDCCCTVDRNFDVLSEIGQYP